MQVTTTTAKHVVTTETRTHTAVFSAEDLKQTAINFATKHVAAEITSSEASVGADGSITVKLVETLKSEEDVADPVEPAKDAAPVVPVIQAAPQIGGGLHAPV